MHTKDRLADELLKMRLPEMAAKARKGLYDDHLSPVTANYIRLVREFDNLGRLMDDLEKVGTPAARMLLDRVIDGEFDATKKESDAWAGSKKGPKVMRRLLKRKKKR